MSKFSMSVRWDFFYSLLLFLQTDEHILNHLRLWLWGNTLYQEEIRARQTAAHILHTCVIQQLLYLLLWLSHRCSYTCTHMLHAFCFVNTRYLCSWNV